jgi:flagellar operon protein
MGEDMQDYVRFSAGINGVRPASPGAQRQHGPSGGEEFQKILQEKLSEKSLKISHHAQMRMNMRNIHLSSAQMAQLTDAVNRAEQKGVKESLILMNDVAFVVSIKNRTVITAIDGPGIKENVFTNIDGAVII